MSLLRHPFSRQSKRIAASLPWALICALTAAPQVATALSFEPTEREWATWPAHCQARYMVSGAGVDSAFSGRVSPTIVRSWEDRLGPEVWYALHHYCAGLIIANRAKLELDKRKREALLQDAIEEDAFTLGRMPAQHPMHAEIAAHKALLHGELGQTEEAMRSFDVAIAACKECDIGYRAKAMYYRSKGQLPDARSVLEEGDRATDGQFASIHYFLGLVLLDMQQPTAAVEHARKAYELGYPLPGLRDRLAKAGHPLD